MKDYKAIDLTDKITRRHQRIQMLCWEVFEKNKKGRELLDLLVDEYLVNRPVAAEKYRSVYGEHYAGIREGQNEMLRELNNMAVNFKEDSKDWRE